MTALLLGLRLGGLLLIGLAFAHLPISRRFLWREESTRLSPLNRQVLLVHAFFVALAVGMMGVWMLFWPRALATPNALGVPVTAGLAIFWSIRLYVQWFVYDHALWRGKRFETAVHVVFTILWAYLAVLFALCLERQLGTG